MTNPVRTHLSLLPEPESVASIAGLRRRFDPTMAAGVPPHVTLVYPEEFDDLDVLLERTSEALVERSPLRLGPGTAQRHDGWVGVTLADVDGDWSRLRHDLGLPNARPEVRPHLTIVHPRTSDRADAAWHEIGGRSWALDLRLDRVALTRTSVNTGLVAERWFHVGG